MAFFNQFCGVNAVTIYSTKIFKALHISPTVGSIITGVSQFLGVIAGAFIIKLPIGLRPFMIFAQFSMATLTLLVGIFSLLNHDTLLVICMTAFLFVY
jgi:hypothetical protein